MSPQCWDYKGSPAHLALKKNKTQVLNALLVSAWSIECLPSLFNLILIVSLDRKDWWMDGWRFLLQSINSDPLSLNWVQHYDYFYCKIRNFSSPLFSGFHCQTFMTHVETHLLHIECKVWVNDCFKIGKCDCTPHHTRVKTTGYQMPMETYIHVHLQAWCVYTHHIEHTWLYTRLVYAQLREHSEQSVEYLMGEFHEMLKSVQSFTD